MSKKIGIVCIIILFSGFLLITINSFSKKLPVSNSDISGDQANQSVSIDITAVGDIMAHSPQFKAQYDSKTNTYDFNNNFQYVKSYISKADLAICNVETVFAGVKERYTGFPKFNCPDSLANALKNSGFDVAITSNNHSLDRGTKGLIRTLDVLRNCGLTTEGTRKTSEPNYVIKDVKGVKVGIISYTYETAEYHGKKTLNGYVVPEDSVGLINTFNYGHLDQDLKQMKNTVDAARNKGAEVIVFYLHWGEEFRTSPDKYERQLTNAISDMGSDIIFASHPHVLQPVEIIDNKKTLKKTVVFYSLGNFLSNQRYELTKNRLSEDGLIANVKIKKICRDGKVKIELKKVEAIPTWVNKYKKGKLIYEILPLDKAYEKRDTLIESHNIKRADLSLKNTIEIIGANDYKQDEMKFIIYDDSEE